MKRNELLKTYQTLKDYEIVFDIRLNEKTSMKILINIKLIKTNLIIQKT